MRYNRIVTDGGTPLQPELPDGIPGHVDSIEAGELILRFGNDKVTFINKRYKGTHITVHFGTKSGVADVHRTVEGVPGQQSWVRLGSITHEDIGRALMETLGQAQGMMSAIATRLCPVRLGWIWHRGMEIVRGGFPGTWDELQQVSVPAKGGRRRIIQADLYEKSVFPLEYLDDIYDSPRAVHTLFAWQGRRYRKVGFVFCVPSGNARHRLYLLRMRDIRQLNLEWDEALSEKFTKYVKWEDPKT